MRITNRMLSDNAIRQLQANIERLAKSQEQVSTTRKLNRPSDGPSDTRAAVKVRDTLAELQQDQRNIDTADRSLSAADGALGAANDIVQRARELALQGANGSLSPSDLQSIGLEVDQLEGALLQQSQAKAGDSYVFSGFRTDRAPYATATGAYQGDAAAITARIAPGLQVRTNVTADVAFAPALGALEALRAELAAGKPVSAATISALDGGQAALLQARSTIGATQNRVADTRTTLDGTILAAQKLLSDLVDVDMAQAISDLSSREASYQAALKVNANILQTSLLDYIH
jgi:flagellar hook-associated protein 3 FlgL